MRASARLSDLVVGLTPAQLAMTVEAFFATLEWSPKRLDPALLSAEAFLDAL